MFNHSIQEKRVVNKIMLRIVPLVTLCYLGAYVDRQNIGFAKLQMADALHIGDTAFALGASLFFIGYMICEIPSNLLLHKFGASRWLARIGVSWGIITVLLAFTQNITMFYILRFLLGVAEAGFMPGIVYYFSLWFPSQYRVRIIGYFTLGSSIGNMLGGSICGWLMNQHGLFSLDGWQVVFLVTGMVPTVVGILVFFLLPDVPENQKFLTREEATWLQKTLDAERNEIEQDQPKKHNPLSALLNIRVLEIAVLFMLISMVSYGLNYWIPSLVKSFGVDYTINGLLNSIPYFLATLVLIFVVPLVRKNDYPIYAMFIAAVVGLVCFILATFLSNNIYRFMFLSLGGPCLYILLPCIWTLPSRFLTGGQAAVGIAVITSMGSFGGFLGQNCVAWVKDLSGSSYFPMLVPATACLVLSIILANLIIKTRAQRAPKQRFEAANP